MLNEKREDYERFFKEFGNQIKYGIYSSFGMNKEMLQDLLLFTSSKEDKLITLKEYKEKNEFAIAHAERMNVIADYSSIENTDEYKNLVANIDKFTKEEITEKADAIVGKYARQGMQFSFKEEPEISRKPVVRFDINKKSNPKAKSYSALFD